MKRLRLILALVLPLSFLAPLELLRPSKPPPWPKQRQMAIRHARSAIRHSSLGCRKSPRLGWVLGEQFCKGS